MMPFPRQNYNDEDWNHAYWQRGGKGGSGGHKGDGGRTVAQPHLFGANALSWRQGGSVVNTDTPPTWRPEMAYDHHFPYTLKEYVREVQRWMAATKVAEARQGPLLALSIGGAGRVVVE